MEYAKLETATLKDVTDDYYYDCSCQSCLHTARLSISKLKVHLGDDFPLVKIRDRLKCQICSSRNVTITFLEPHQKGAACMTCLIRSPASDGSMSGCRSRMNNFSLVAGLI